MKYLALAVVALAGCSDPPGIHLVVAEAGTGADRVELFLATRTCAGCDGKLAPAGVTEKLDGKVWLLDGDAAAGTPTTTAPISGGRAIFDLHPPGTTDTTVPLVLAIGWAGDRLVGVATLRALVVPSDRGENWKVELSAATAQPSSDATTPTGRRVWLWRRGDPSKAACVGFERSDGTTVKREWLVPEDDPDCDEVAAECDPYAYHAQGLADPGHASCVTEAHLTPASPQNTCLLGGVACTDGQPQSAATCTPTTPRYCLADSLCQDATCLVDLPGCIADQRTPYIDCTFPATEQLAPCTNGGPDPTIDLGVLFPSPSQSRCKKPKFLSGLANNPSLTSVLTNGQAEFSPTTPTNPCRFGLAFTGGAPSEGDFVTALDLEIDPLGRHVVLPVRLQVHAATCGGMVPICKVVGLDAVDGISHCTR